MVSFAKWLKEMEQKLSLLGLLPLESDEFAMKIVYLYEHPKEKKEMGRCSRELFEQRFCMDNQIGKLLEIYKRNRR